MNLKTMLNKVYIKNKLE